MNQNVCVRLYHFWKHTKKFYCPVTQLDKFLPEYFTYIQTILNQDSFRFLKSWMISAIFVLFAYLPKSKRWPSNMDYDAFEAWNTTKSAAFATLLISVIVFWTDTDMFLGKNQFQIKFPHPFSPFPISRKHNSRLPHPITPVHNLPNPHPKHHPLPWRILPILHR